MVVFENIKSERLATKILGVDRWFLYKVMKKKCKILSLSMPLWGAKEQLPQLDLLGVSVKKLV